MRLEGPGRPTLVQAESFERARATPHKTEKVAEVAKPRGAGSTSSEGEGSRLGKILEIIETAQEKKKRRNYTKKIKDAVKAYQRAHLMDPIEQTGQRLSIKV